MSEGRNEYEVLHSIPSIGDTTACRLIGELGDIRRFQNAKQLNAYVGIDIMRYPTHNTVIVLTNEEIRNCEKSYIL